jgi:YgiT-type zinc finger domain-containing protein
MSDGLDLDQLRSAIRRSNGGDACPLCGGTKRPGSTTFTADLGFGVVVVRDVPATVCSQCGADWISDDVVSRLEGLLADAKVKRLQVEVMFFGMREADGGVDRCSHI